MTPLTIHQKSAIIGFYRNGNESAVIAGIFDVTTEYIDAVINGYLLVSKHIRLEYERRTF